MCIRDRDDSGLNYQISSVLTNYKCQMNVLAELLHELSHLKHIRDWRIIPASNSIYKEYNVFSHLKPTKAQITKAVSYTHLDVYKRQLLYRYLRLRFHYRFAAERNRTHHLST